MATWTTRAHFRGTDDSSWDSPALSSSPTSSTPPSTPSPWSEDTDFFNNTHQGDEGDAMDDSGFQDYMEVQLGVTGEMSVVERLQYLLDTGQFSDVNVRVGQGNNVAVFKAHRLLLATASQPLYKLVYQVNPHPGPNDITTIRVTDMKPSDFQHILRYIYTDNIDCKNINVAFELLRASRKWGLAGLGIKSLTFLEEFIDNFVPTTEESKSNLFDLLVLSEDTLRDTSEKCWEILFKNADILIPCEGYLKLDKKMVRKIICNKDLKIENQLKLFEAIRDWGLRYVTEHKLTLAHLGDVVEELIKVVDFDKISDCDFLNTVLTSECLGKAEVIAFFMTHGLEIPRNLDFNNNKQLPFWMCLCATSDQQDKGSRTGSTKPSFKQSNLSTVNEALSKICSLTQNGSVLEFNKVCRFRKGYRCPQKELNQEHELRFRVDKNIKLLGVGFGFLFSPTDMGINVHCQGPWETRQWSDISQAYCRVAGDKQETADVRLMFLQPVRIEARQCYKVLVKTVRMSQGSSEVELWGGTGGLYCVETEDAEFHFIKAAVDPTKSVEESDGDTRPGVITELLYQLDTEESEETTNLSQRRRRPDPQEEEPNNMQSNPWRRSHRPDVLRVPETPVQRKRSPPSDDYKTPEAPPLSRRRESSDIGRKTSEEYMPTSFSTNRWRTARRKEEEESERKKSVEEYMPSSFSTNRWRTTKPKEEEAERKKSVEEYKPSSYSTNQRWRSTTTTRAKEDDKVESRKTSTEDKWRPRPSQEEKKDTPFGSRVFTKTEEATSSASHPFLRRRESKDSTDIPFYMRSRTTAQQDDNKGTAAGALGRSRYGAGTATTTAGESRSSRFLYTDGSSSFSTSTRPTGSSSLLSSRYGRESSLTRPRDSSISRFGSGSSSYLGRYDNADSPSSVSSGRGTNKLSASSSDSRYTSLAGKYSTDTTAGRTTNTDSASAASSRYGRDVTPSSSSRYGRDTTPSSTRYNTDSTTKPSRYGTESSTSKYGTEAESGAGSRYSSPARHIRRYGASTTGSGSDLTALGGRSGQGQRRYGSSATGSAGNLGALSTRTSGSGVGSVGTGAGSSSRYGSSTATSLSSMYSTPAPTGGSLTNRSKASDLITSLSSKYASALSSANNKFGTGRCYTTPAPTRVTGRGAGLSSYTPSNKYGASPSSGGISSSKYSTAGRYTSPAPSASSNR